MGLRSSTTTDEVFQHLKVPPVITKSVFKLKMVGVNFWKFWWGFSIFSKKLQNVCSVAANPDQMDKNGCDFWTQRPPKPSNPLQTSSPEIPYITMIIFPKNSGDPAIGTGKLACCSTLF